MQLQNNMIGIGLKLLNLLGFTVISLLLVFIKSNTINVILLIDITAIVCLLPWAITTKGKYLKVDNKKQYINYFLRALFNFVGIFSWIKAMRIMGANEATAISYMIPIFTTIMAMIFCGEKLNKKCMIAVCISFFGVYIILDPQKDNFTLYGAIMALLCSFMWACYDIVCKKQTITEHCLAQTFYTFVFALVFSLVMLMFTSSNLLLDDVFFIFVIGIISVINITILFLAYKFAPIYLLMPFSYCRLIFMFIGSYLVFNIQPNYHLFLGAVVIALTSFYIFHQTHKGNI